MDYSTGGLLDGSHDSAIRSAEIRTEHTGHCWSTDHRAWASPRARKKPASETTKYVTPLNDIGDGVTQERYILQFNALRSKNPGHEHEASA